MRVRTFLQSAASPGETCQLWCNHDSRYSNYLWLWLSASSSVQQLQNGMTETATLLLYWLYSLLITTFDICSWVLFSVQDNLYSGGNGTLCQERTAFWKQLGAMVMLYILIDEMIFKWWWGMTCEWTSALSSSPSKSTPFPFNITVLFNIISQNSETWHDVWKHIG